MTDIAPSEVAELAKVIRRADRIHQVLSWIVAGQSQHDIEQTIAAAWPDAKAKPLIVGAVTQLSKTTEDDPDVVRGWAIQATRAIYTKALEVADLTTALRALKQVVELQRG